MGYFLANQKYNAGRAVGDPDENFQSILSSRTDFVALESFVPGFASNDPMHWIPKGLMFDLIDNGEIAQTNVNDNVAGFTITQIFAGHQADVTTVPQYRARLEQQNPTIPPAAINNLFASYNY